MYSGNELDSLRALARRHGRVRPRRSVPGRRPARRPAFNSATHLLKRAAMFHLDLAGGGRRRRAVGHVATIVSRSRSRVDDGRALGQFAVAGHIELAREALEHVSQPCASQTRAGQGPVGAGLVRGVAGLPAVAGAVRGRARPARGRAVSRRRRGAGAGRRDPRGPGRARVPGRARTRPRLARPLGSADGVRRIGRVRRAVAPGAAARRPAGRSAYPAGPCARPARQARGGRARAGAGGVGRRRGSPARPTTPACCTDASWRRRGTGLAARLAYEQAARLYPTAHAPRLALSQMLRATGDAVAAVNMLGRLVEPSNDAPDDPWWRYHITAGRSLERRMHALWASTPAPVGP